MKRLAASMLMILLPIICTVAATARDLSLKNDPFQIVLVTWRGITGAEKGFMDYLERKEVNAVYRFMDCGKDPSRLPGFVKKIRKIKPDLVYVFGTTATLGICGPEASYPDRRYITEIPVVFNIVSVPVKSGIVRSIESSGRNITGTSNIAPITAQLRAMDSLIPIAGKRLGVLFNPQETNSLVAVQELETRAEAWGYTVVKVPFPPGPDGLPHAPAIEPAASRLAQAGVDMAYLPSDSFIVANCAKIAACLNHYRVPSFSATETPVIRGGALAGLVSHYYNLGQLAGHKAEQILVLHRKPSEIPVETLSRFSFLVNMKTARQIDWYPPITVLKFAEVIK